MMDVRAVTGVETYVNDEPGDPNPGIIVDSQNAGRALSSEEARALAAELIERATYFDTVSGVRQPRSPLRVTFAETQDWDGVALVLGSLVGATVEITYRPGWAPYIDDRPVTDYHPTSCEIMEVLEDSVEVAYDDGSYVLSVPFHDIEEVEYQ